MVIHGERQKLWYEFRCVNIRVVCRVGRMGSRGVLLEGKKMSRSYDIVV